MDTSIIEAIKFNCDVSDAKYWGYFSICGLLLRYRDLYRSEKGLKPWTNFSRPEIAEWIDAKEARWPDLEQEEFRKVVVDGTEYDPFDVASLNRALKPKGLVYGAGYGMYMKPTFFLAELKSIRQIAGLSVHTSGRELVRDLFTGPAMLQENTVFLRLEPLLVLLHYKLSEVHAGRNSALEDAFAHYGFRERQIIDAESSKKGSRVWPNTMARCFSITRLRNTGKACLNGKRSWPLRETGKMNTISGRSRTLSPIHPKRAL